jgi:hypothetical protein
VLTGMLGALALYHLSVQPGAALVAAVFDRNALVKPPAGFGLAPRTVTEDRVPIPVPDAPTAYLDIYTPDGAGGRPRPVILWVHGGGFISNSAATVADYAILLAHAGYTVASLDYSLAPGAHYPVPVRQSNAALRYLRSNPSRFGGDPARIVLGGDSAGAQIASQLAAVQTDAALARSMRLTAAVPHAARRRAVLRHLVDDVVAGDRPRFWRALDQGRGFGAAIAQAVELALAGGGRTGAQQGSVGRLAAVVLDHLVRPGRQVGPQVTGGGQGAIGIEPVGGEIVDHRLHIAPPAIEARVTHPGAAMTAVITWYRAPMDRLTGHLQHNIYDFEGLVLTAYILCAFGFAVLAGLLLRRSIPAMVAAFIPWLAIRLVVEFVFRPHFMTPLTMARAQLNCGPPNGCGYGHLSQTCARCRHRPGPPPPGLTTGSAYPR